MVRVVRISVLGAVAGLLLGGAVAAQSETFAQGVRAFRMGNLEEARQKFEEVLAADPTHQQALEIWRSVDHAVWRAMLAENNEISKIAQLMLERATRGQRELSRDRARIDELVGKVLSDDYGERRQAQLDLRAQHGVFAVPALVDKLDAGKDMVQVYAIMALQELGRDATLPLIAGLKSDNPDVRRNIVAVLAETRDARAAPALARLAANDPKDGVREIARRALEGLGDDTVSNPVDLYLARARDLLSGHGIRASDRSAVVWSYVDGALTPVDVPDPIYHFELGKRAAQAALRLDPASRDANALLARAYLGEAAAISGSLAANPDAEMLAALEGRVRPLRMAAAATGIDAVRAATSAAMQAGQVPTAVAAIELLGDLESAADLASSPLTVAVRSEDSRIAYAAALALADASAGRGLPAAGAVIDKLASAVDEESILFVKVIDNHEITKRAIQEASFQRGVHKSVVESAAHAISDLYQFPLVDVVVINEVLPDARPESVIGLIRKDPRLADTKILLLTKDPAAAAEQFGEHIDGTIQGPASGESLKAAIQAALADVPPDARRARADRVAIAASQALEDLARRQIDVTSALDDLVAQLGRGDEVAIPAARAIGAGGSLAQADALAKLVASQDASLELRIAAAQALGAIFGRAGDLGQDLFDTLAAVAGSDADIALREAVAEALGKATLTPANKLRLLEIVAVGPATGATG